MTFDAQGGSWSEMAQMAGRQSCHSVRSEAESQNPPPRKRIAVGGSCDCAQDDAWCAGWQLVGVGADGGPAKLSFCAQRSEVAESTPEEAHRGGWILRLRAGWRLARRTTPGAQGDGWHAGWRLARRTTLGAQDDRLARRL